MVRVVSVGYSKDLYFPIVEDTRDRRYEPEEEEKFEEEVLLPKVVQFGKKVKIQ